MLPHCALGLHWQRAPGCLPLSCLLPSRRGYFRWPGRLPGVFPLLLLPFSCRLDCHAARVLSRRWGGRHELVSSPLVTYGSGAMPRPRPRRSVEEIGAGGLGVSPWTRLGPAETCQEETGEGIHRYMGTPARDMAVGVREVVLQFKETTPQCGYRH